MYLAAQRRCPSGRRPVERHPVRCSTEREIRDFLNGKTDGEDLLHRAVRSRSRRAGAGAADRVIEALTVGRAPVTRQPGWRARNSRSLGIASAAVCNTRKIESFSFPVLR